MTTPSTSKPTLPDRILTDRDLDDFWRTLMGPLGFGTRRLWLVLVEPDGRLVTQIVQVDDVPATMTAGEADNLMIAFGEPLVEAVPGGSLAILFSRPGRDQLSVGDRQLARGLTAAAARAAVPLRPLFFANDVTLQVFAADDLIPDGPRSGPRH